MRPSDMDRYQLYISDHPGDTAAIRVYDSMLKRVLLTWQGAVAREMLDSDMLPFCVRAASCHGCDKGLIQRLTLAAAAIGMALDRGGESGRLRRRLASLDRRLSPLHHYIAQMLFSHPDRHFGHEEILCLLTLQNPSSCRVRIQTHLEDLVAWEVVQRVTVGNDRVFYDIDTTPHLHVYDPISGELADAPNVGVVIGDQAALAAPGS